MGYQLRMASFQSMGSGLRAKQSSEKITKPRSKVVKPILKKLSHSEKNSLDLDRGWEEQDGLYQSSSLYESGGAIRTGSARDVSFAFSDAAPGGSRRYNHSRSISGTSHVSVATSGSGSAIGIGSGVGPRTFVHPFQQTPRTATPPLSYANSLASFNNDGRDYSPIITEDNDYDPLDPTSNYNHNNHNHPPTNPNSHSTQSLNPRRPSLPSQRTSSFSDIKNPSHPPLRINTTSRAMATTPAQSSRLAHVSSRSDLNSPDSPNSTNVSALASPSSSVAPMSPFSRSSFEAPSFARLRAKSDLDTATRAEHLREARRKFEAREQAKEEKYAREEIKRRERADNKRAQELEKQTIAIRKEREAIKRREEAAALADAMPRMSKHARKMSATSSGRPSISRKPTFSESNEKFISGSYETMESRSPPAFGNEAGGARDVIFETPKRSAAKKKTHGAWTMFILWLRTRLLRMRNP